MAYITTCPACGSKRFTIAETYIYDGEVQENGTLLYMDWPGSGGIDLITCTECNREVSVAEFVAIEFD